ncbi:MAG: DNA-directed RNA polymerase subunit K [Candidatus Nanoarchaeia archaeon]
MIEQLEEKFTKYEIARILGARSLQLAMDAPVLLKLTKEEEEDLNYDSLKIAEKELVSGVLPITVKRPLPKRSEKTVKKLSEEEIKERLLKEAQKQEKEMKKEVSGEPEASNAKEGETDEEEAEGPKKEGDEDEIAELATPEDEADSGEENEGSEEI